MERHPGDSSQSRSHSEYALHYAGYGIMFGGLRLRTIAVSIRGVTRNPPIRQIYFPTNISSYAVVAPMGASRIVAM